ncbi:hypothetical protein ACWGCP_28505, partial [Streptomyces niveus]
APATADEAHTTAGLRPVRARILRDRGEDGPPPSRRRQSQIAVYCISPDPGILIVSGVRIAH